MTSREVRYIAGEFLFCGDAVEIHREDGKLYRVDNATYDPTLFIGWVKRDYEAEETVIFGGMVW